MYNDDDFQLQSYQDDLATDDDVTDPLMDETGDDPTEDLGIPPSELKDELDKEEDEERGYLEGIDDDSDE